jgi:hypothetical protein
MLERDDKQTQGGGHSPAVFEVDIGLCGEQQPADFNVAPTSRHVQRGAAANGSKTRHGSR